VISHVRLEIENGGLIDDIDLILTPNFLTLKQIEEKESRPDTLTYSSNEGCITLKMKKDFPEHKFLTSRSSAGDVLDLVVFSDFSISFLKNGILLATLKNPFSYLISKDPKKERTGLNTVL